MISYIFKNKTKNILAIIFTILSFLNSNIMYNIYAYAIARKFPLLSVFRLLPYILILTYLFTLKKEYRFKNYLFPAAFLIFAALNSYSVLTSLIQNLKYLNTSELIIWFVWTALYGLVVLAAYILCFLGAIKNFKNVRFLRIGMIVLMVAMLLSYVMDFIFVGGFEYFANIPQENSLYVYISMLRAVVKIVIGLLFCFGIFNLTLNKQEEAAETE